MSHASTCHINQAMIRYFPHQSNDNNAVFDAIAADHKTLAAEIARKEISFKIRTGDDEEGQICEALLSGNIEAAVELCLNAGRQADAIIIAMTGTLSLINDSVNLFNNLCQLYRRRTRDSCSYAISLSKK